LDLDLVYRKEDINMMSFRSENKDFGTYSIFDYKGSYNCRHSWKRLVFKKTDNPVGNSDVNGFRSVPLKELPSSYVPSDSKATAKNNKVKLEIENQIKNEKNMILAEIKIEKEGSINKMSLVEKPAIEVNFLKLSEDNKELQFSKNEEKRNITGAALIPNKKYYRNSEFFEKTLNMNSDGYIFFSENTVKECAIDFLKNADNSINLQHSDNVDKNDVVLIESWLIETKNDKAYDLGFSSDELPVGTWMMTQHINNDNIWNDIKNNKINGFSIEGSPAITLVNSNIQFSDALTDDFIANEVCKIICSHNSK
jgi:hypothetical protein